MKQMLSFLVIADDTNQLMLLSATLHRKFPNSVVQTCQDSAAAIEVAREQRLDTIVACRSSDLDELPLIEALRAVTAAPIVLMADPHHQQAAIEAGASRYLHQDEWLIIGTTVAELIEAHSIDA